MENFAPWALFIAVSTVAYWCFVALKDDIRACRDEIRACRDSVAALGTELDALREAMAGLTQDIERFALTPAEQEARHYDRLPALTSDVFVPLPPGEKLTLLLKAFAEYHEVEYVHKELIYRSPGQKDAAAYGQARLRPSDEFQNVRILFAGLHATAALRGLSEQGHVKLGRLLRDAHFARTESRTT